MRGVITHVSDPKINTACTNALKNIPDTLGLAPSCTRILVSRAQLFHAFFKFPATARKFSSPSVKTRPNYLNKVTISSCLPCAWKDLSTISRISSSSIRRRFLSAPLAHWEVERCRLFSACHGTIMLRRGHRGWGRFPSSNIIMVYRKFH